MNLTNSQYDQLMVQYTERQNRAIEALDARKEEVYRALPELKELEARARKLSLDYVRDSAGDESASETYRLEMEKLEKERTRLLRDNGWDTSYLEPDYECPDCKDTGFVDGVKCHCMKKQAIKLFYRQSHLGDALEQQSFDLFDLSVYPDDRIDDLTGMTPRDNMREVLKVAKHYVRTFDDQPDVNLLLYGDTGVGKTFLSHCIAHELLDAGHSVLYLDAIRLFEILEARQFDRELDFSDKNAMLSYLLDSELLIIDDLGTEMTNGFTTTQLYHVIEGRLIRHRSTIISTNLSIRDMNDIYSERVFSRIMSQFQTLRLIGDDIRLMRRK